MHLQIIVVDQMFSQETKMDLTEIISFITVKMFHFDLFVYLKLQFNQNL
jgi:hypothetical protein